MTTREHCLNGLDVMRWDKLADSRVVLVSMVERGRGARRSSSRMEKAIQVEVMGIMPRRERRRRSRPEGSGLSNVGVDVGRIGHVRGPFDDASCTASEGGNEVVDTFWVQGGIITRV